MDREEGYNVLQVRIRVNRRLSLTACATPKKPAGQVRHGTSPEEQQRDDSQALLRPSRERNKDLSPIPSTLRSNQPIVLLISAQLMRLVAWLPIASSKRQRCLLSDRMAHPDRWLYSEPLFFLKNKFEFEEAQRHAACAQARMLMFRGNCGGISHQCIHLLTDAPEARLDAPMKCQYYLVCECSRLVAFLQLLRLLRPSLPGLGLTKAVPRHALVSLCSTPSWCNDYAEVDCSANNCYLPSGIC